MSVTEENITTLDVFCVFWSLTVANVNGKILELLILKLL